LTHTLKKLRENWEIAKEGWADQVARDFEKNHIVPVEQQSKSAIQGMEKIAEVLRRVRKECSEPR
jgi:hypothetical protein